MARRVLPLGLLAPISLVVLVVALGALQYRWVGQVSEAEREQLKSSLDRRAREFADDFDREIGRAYQIFRPAPGFSPQSPDRFAQQYDEWQSTSPFAGIVKATYYVAPDHTGRDFTLHKYVPATRAFEKAAWPEPLAPVRARLIGILPRSEPAAQGRGSMITLTTLPVLPEVPALVIPETQAGVGQPPAADSREPRRVPGVAVEFLVTVRGGRNHVVVELDRNFITKTMLPVLAERHFPDSGADRFRLSIVDGASHALLSRG